MRKQLRKCWFVERDYVNTLMCQSIKCLANRYIFRSHLNCSESTAGFRRWQEISQSADEFFLLLLDSENGCPPYLNSTSGFDFDLFTVHHYQHSILHRHTKFHPNQSMHSRVVMSYRSFKMVAIELENYTWLPFWWPRLSRNIKIYLHTKFWWDISIHS